MSNSLAVVEVETALQPVPYPWLRFGSKHARQESYYYIITQKYRSQKFMQITKHEIILYNVRTFVYSWSYIPSIFVALSAAS